MDYLIHLLIMSGIFGILALSLNLVVGHTGLLSVSHASFWGIGAYASAILMSEHGMSFILAMFMGMSVVGGVAGLVGLVFSKFSGDYYALATLGFNVIVFGVMLNWEQLTRGPLGISGIPKPEIFGITFFTPQTFLVLVLGVLCAMYYFSEYLTASNFGRVLHGIREDEQVLRVMGYQTTSYKLVVYIISAMMAGIAGSLYGSYITFIDPMTFHVMESVLIIAMVILGGLAHNRAVIIGAMLFVLLPEALRFVGFPPDMSGHMRQIVYGLLLVLLMLYRPQGMFGNYRL